MVDTPNKRPKYPEIIREVGTESSGNQKVGTISNSARAGVAALSFLGAAILATSQAACADVIVLDKTSGSSTGVGGNGAGGESGDGGAGGEATEGCKEQIIQNPNSQPDNGKMGNIVDYDGTTIVTSNGNVVEIFKKNAQTLEFEHAQTLPGNHPAFTIEVRNGWIVTASAFKNAVEVYRKSADGKYHKSQEDISLGNTESSALGRSIKFVRDDEMYISDDLGDPDIEVGVLYKFVFDQSSNSWKLSSQTSAPDAEPSDGFGFSVQKALNANITAVGAQQKNSYAGEVYILSDESFAEEISPVTTSPQGRFGFAVALSEDGTTLAVGAPTDSVDPKKPNHGSVTIYTLGESSYTPTATVYNPDLSDSLFFGVDLAIDNQGRIITTDPGSSSTFIFDGNGNLLTTISDTATPDYKGSLAIDANGTLVIGQPHDAENSSGTVRVTCLK